MLKECALKIKASRSQELNLYNLNKIKLYAAPNAKPAKISVGK